MRAVDRLWHDAVFAARLLRKAPVFTAAVVLTLGLGVGANTAVFSVVNAIVLRPLPVRDGHRLAMIATHAKSNRPLGGVSFADLQDYRAASANVFEDIAGYRVGFLSLAPEGGQPARVLVTEVTGNYFPLLDIRPALGRLIRADEGGSRRRDAVAVLGYSTWQRRFGGDRSVVGQIVRVNGQPCTIVGVVPSSFLGTFAFSESELYLPMNWSAGVDFGNRQGRGLHAIARLGPMATFDSAQARMNTVAEQLARTYPDSNMNVAVRVLPERYSRPEEDQYRTNVLGAAVMLALVGVVMLIAAVNVINLLLARATVRRRELTIRAAIGAGRGRLVQQMVTESLILAAIGGGVGVLCGTWTAQALATIRLPGDLPVLFDFRLDGRVFAYAATVVVLTGVFVGLVPALRASSADLNFALRQSQSESKHGRRGGGILVVTQVALCFALVVVAGLFARSLFEAERADLGFRPERVLNVHMDVAQFGLTETQGGVFFEQISRIVRLIPGVEDVSFAFTIPMGYIRTSNALEAEAQPVERTERVSAGKNIVSPRYFQTLGIPIVRGRSFSDQDDEQSRRVAIVNQRLADLLWPGRDPIGRRFRSAGRDRPWVEVVGLTNTGKYRFLFEELQPYFYVPIAQEYTPLRVLQVRTSVSVDALAPAIERAIRTFEPNLLLYDVQSMTQALGSGPGFFPVRVAAASAATLGLLAFALAVVGIYGVVSCLASQRTREIGVRMALGANQHDIVRLVLQDGLNLVLCGLAAGLLITLSTSRIIERFLFGHSALDPLTVATVASLLGGAALVACTIPAWRAARVNPTVVLHSE